MRILAVQPFIDGVGHYAPYAARLCEDFSARGHSVTLCTNTPASGLRTAHPFKVVAADFALRPFEEVRSTHPLRWLSGRIRANLKTLRAALRLAPKSDVVQLFSYELISTAILLALVPSARPVILEIAAPNFDTSKHYGSWAERIWRHLQKFAIQHLARHGLAAINVYSDSHAVELRRQLDVPAEFPIGVTADSRPLTESSISKADSRVRLGLPADATVFLFFGTLRRDKGLATLLEAFRGAPPGCHLVIAGQPLDLDPPEIDDARITARYEFIPEDETEIYFTAADALVLPYERFYSGSSGPLFDACAYGLPVIASDVSEMGELVRAFTLGLSTIPGDAGSLAAALNRFHSLTPATRYQFSISERLFLKSSSTSSVANNYLKLYESLTGIPSDAGAAKTDICQ